MYKIFIFMNINFTYSFDPFQIISCSSLFFHRVEKSRGVIPTLLEAARSKPKYAEMNWREAYRLLFTLDNLKLVQVGCHKKAARSDNKCSVDSFWVT